MLLIPYVVGAAAAGKANIGVAAGLVAVLLLYIARPGLMLLLKRRFRQGSFGEGAPRLLGGVAALAVGSLLIFAWLWQAGGFAGIIWFGLLGLAISLVHTALSLRRRERSAFVELAGIALLTLTAPLSYHLASGGVDRAAAGLWLTNALYFGASVYFVKMKLQASIAGRRAGGGPIGFAQKISLARNTISYLLFMGAAVALAVLTGLAPPLSWLSFVPLTAYVALSIIHMSPELNIKREGWSQAVLSLIFAALLIASFHL